MSRATRWDWIFKILKAFIVESFLSRVLLLARIREDLLVLKILHKGARADTSTTWRSRQLNQVKSTVSLQKQETQMQVEEENNFLRSQKYFKIDRARYLWLDIPNLIRIIKSNERYFLVLSRTNVTHACGSRVAGRISITIASFYDL